MSAPLTVSRTYIRATATQHPEIAERWLAEGILTEYSRQDLEDGTLYVNIVWAESVVDTFVLAKANLATSFHDRKSELCPGN